MQLFYSKDITPEGFYTLDAEESRHAVRVLRMREGDGINVTDGRGNLYHCRIVDANDRACVVEATITSSQEQRTHHAVSAVSEEQTANIGNQAFSAEPTAHPEHPSIHLAVAPTKNPARMEWLVEKAVEMGVGEITLLQCDHSERSFLKTDRLEKLAISAMKQSLHTLLPKINPAVSLKDWLTHGTPHAIRLIAHCEADKPRTKLSESLKPGSDAVVLIGPEGDFSPEEIALAIDSGFLPVSFGDARLRTETAGLSAVMAIQLAKQLS